MLLRAGISRDVRTKVDRAQLQVVLTLTSCLFQLGTSPLHFSSQYGHYGTAEVLLRAGISRDARTKVDRTPLHVASQEGHIDIVNLLLQHSADIDAKDMVGQALS